MYINTEREREREREKTDRQREREKEREKTERERERERAFYESIWNVLDRLCIYTYIYAYIHTQSSSSYKHITHNPQLQKHHPSKSFASPHHNVFIYVYKHQCPLKNKILKALKKTFRKSSSQAHVYKHRCPLKKNP